MEENHSEATEVTKPFIRFSGTSIAFISGSNSRRLALTALAPTMSNALASSPQSDNRVQSWVLLLNTHNIVTYLENAKDSISGKELNFRSIPSRP